MCNSNVDFYLNGKVFLFKSKLDFDKQDKRSLIRDFAKGVCLF